MRFGVQLFGPLNGMQGDVMGKLRALAQAGITEIEPCVDMSSSWMPEVIWPAGWLMEHADEIMDMGLSINSIHVFTQNLPGAMDGLKAIAKKVELKQFVVKSPREINETSLHQAALNYMKAADELSELGVDLLLHNEAGDIQTKIAGKTAYEHLLDLCMGKVYAQVDVGWVQFGGEDPLEFLHRNAWRVKSIHYKDFPAGTAQPVDVPIGTGGVDLTACFYFARSKHISQLIDQEHFGPDVPGELAKTCRLLNGYAYTKWMDMNPKYTLCL